MDKIFAVSLQRIQRNSAEHLNKLENSVLVYCIYFTHPQFLWYSQRFFDKFTHRKILSI